MLKENYIEIYHIGSTSVPGLCAKPIIDMMCIIKDLKKATEALIQAGYESKGEFNLPLRLFFSKKWPNYVHIHVVLKNNGEIAWNLTFRNYLRENSDARNMYAKTKLDLIKASPDRFDLSEIALPEYTIKKDGIIRKIAKMAGSNSYRFVFISDLNEIKSYKQFMNLQEIDFGNKNINHLCLYKGVDVVTAACVEFDFLKQQAYIQQIVCPKPEHKDVFLNKIYRMGRFL
ncbi:MAG: GrpB family protein [Oscillospiraceae bacterium]